MLKLNVFKCVVLTVSFVLPLHSSSWTNRLIAAKDRASIQINVGKLDAEGKFSGDSEMFAISGYVRANAESDIALTQLIETGKARFY
jgi:small subunit ribosomal protein S21e